MITVLCWIIIHTNNNRLDDRKELKVQGTVMREVGQDSLLVNFYEAFTALKVDMKFNKVEQIVLENSCLYE